MDSVAQAQSRIVDLLFLAGRGINMIMVLMYLILLTIEFGIGDIDITLDANIGKSA
jgi:hypothetical protein